MNFFINFIVTAQAQNQPATLHVLKSNHPARKLYERLGFTIIAEEEHKYLMKWQSGKVAR